MNRIITQKAKRNIDLLLDVAEKNNWKIKRIDIDKSLKRDVINISMFIKDGKGLFNCMSIRLHDKTMSYYLDNLDKFLQIGINSYNNKIYHICNTTSEVNKILKIQKEKMKNEKEN